MHYKLLKGLILTLVFSFFAIVSGNNSVSANANIQFQATNVHYLNADNNIVVVEGNFINNDTGSGNIYLVDLEVKCLDANGNLCLNDKVQFNTNININAGGIVPWSFNIRNSNNNGYRGNWKWDVNHSLKWTNI